MSLQDGIRWIHLLKAVEALVLIDVVKAPIGTHQRFAGNLPIRSRRLRVPGVLAGFPIPRDNFAQQARDEDVGFGDQEAAPGPVVNVLGPL